MLGWGWWKPLAELAAGESRADNCNKPGSDEIGKRLSLPSPLLHERTAFVVKPLSRRD